MEHKNRHGSKNWCPVKNLQFYKTNSAEIGLRTDYWCGKLNRGCLPWVWSCIWCAWGTVCVRFPHARLYTQEPSPSLGNGHSSTRTAECWRKEETLDLKTSSLISFTVLKTCKLARLSIMKVRGLGDNHFTTLQLIMWTPSFWLLSDKICLVFFMEILICIVHITLI